MIRFFEEQNLTLERLRDLYAHQTSLIIDELSDYRILSPRDPSKRGGFVTVEVENAGQIVRELRSQHVYVDARGSNLRFGPAPYISSDDIRVGLNAFKKLVKPTQR